MNLITRLFGQSKLMDEPEEEQARWLQEDFLFRVSRESFVEGCDQLPDADGPFGLSAMNPIPVNGVNGEFIYLNRLRARTGVGFMFPRRGSVHSDVSNKPIDRYDLVAVDASQWVTLYLFLYCMRRSTAAPAGLSLTRWGKMTKNDRIFVRLPGFGINYHVPNFPFGLPDVVATDERLNSISPGMGATMADGIRAILDSHKGQWSRPSEH